MSGKQLTKKLSLKTIIGRVDVKELHAANEDKTPKHPNGIDLFTVGGRITGIKTGNSTYGEWKAFIGNCGATRHSDGVEFRGAELFLPSVAETFVEPVVLEAKGAPVDFAFIIGVKPMTKPSGELSYEYTVKPLIEADAVDPLAELMAKMKASAPQLTTGAEHASSEGETTGEIAQTEKATSPEDAAPDSEEEQPRHESAKRERNRNK